MQRPGILNMQRRHFEAIARALLETRPPADALQHVQQWAIDVRRLADVCAVSNVNFDSTKFFDACGYTAAYGRD